MVPFPVCLSNCRFIIDAPVKCPKSIFRPHHGFVQGGRVYDFAIEGSIPDFFTEPSIFVFYQCNIAFEVKTFPVSAWPGQECTTAAAGRIIRGHPIPLIRPAAGFNNFPSPYTTSILISIYRINNSRRFIWVFFVRRSEPQRHPRCLRKETGRTT